MLNITHYQRNANQNHNVVPSHAGQNGCYPKVTSNKCKKGCGEKGTLLHLTSPVAQMVKCLSTIQETWLLSLGREDPLEKEMAIHSSTIAWKIPWTEELGRLQSMGSQRVGHDWATSLSLHRWWECKVVHVVQSHYGEQCGDSLKNWN